MWQFPDDVLDALDRRLAEVNPDVTVEAGSGRSTAVMVRHARRHVALEHLPTIARRTRTEAAHPSLDLRVAKLVPYMTPAGRFSWYDTPLPDRIDFALIDGPPGRKVGRQAAGFAIVPNLAAGAEVWLDDADRDHEQECVALWVKHLPITVSPHPSLDRVAIIRRSDDV